MNTNDSSDQQILPGAPIKHPDAPEEQIIHLKGAYAIFPDGKVLLNNPEINKLPNVTFTDFLPDWHKQQIERAKKRDAELQAAMKRAQEEQELRQKILDQQLADQAAKVATDAVTKQSPALEQFKSYKTVIEGARTVTQIKAIMDSLGIKIMARELEPAKNEAVEAAKTKLLG